MNTKSSSSKENKKIKKRKGPNLSEFRHLQKKKNTKARQGVIDYDYLDKLSKEELDFLNKFTGEYYGANFTDNPVHEKSKYKKDCEDRNNRRNGDLLTIKEITGGLNTDRYGRELETLIETVSEPDFYNGIEEVMEQLEDSPVSINLIKKLT